MVFFWIPQNILGSSILQSLWVNERSWLRDRQWVFCRHVPLPKSLGRAHSIPGRGKVCDRRCCQPGLDLSLFPIRVADTISTAGVIPPARHKFSAASFPRLFITDMAVTQFLQPYPVAGSQLMIAAVPVLLWAFVCMADGMEGLSTLWRRNALPLVKNLRILNKGWPRPILAGAILIAAVTKIYDGGIIPLRYLGPPSNLSGSRSLRLPPEQESDYEFIAGSISANCDVLFTLPGMGSFNFWSGQLQRMERNRMDEWI